LVGLVNVRKFGVNSVSWATVTQEEIVSNDGFTAPYRYVGDEKYRKALVSLRRAEYRFSGFVPATSDDGTPIVGKLLPRKLDPMAKLRL